MKGEAMLPLSISSSLPGETDPTKPYGALPSVNADFAPVSTRGNIAQGAAFFFFFSPQESALAKSEKMSATLPLRTAEVRWIVTKCSYGFSLSP